MTDEEKDFDRLIDQIKAVYPMTPAPRDAIDLNGFSILMKGEGYNFSYCWQFGPGLYKKYLIESVDPSAFLSKLTDKLVEDIQNFDELYLEIRGNRCLLLHLRPANYDDTLGMIKIAKGLNPRAY